MIDLHMHSKHSADGTYSLEEILKRAEANNLKYISITDHDDVDIYEEIEKINIRDFYSGQIIKGIELKVLYKGLSMELLGYNIDTQEISKSKWLDKNIKGKIQDEEFRILKNSCKQLNLRLDSELSLGANEFAGTTIYDCLLKYKENKQVIEDLNITSDSNFYRNHICNKNSPLYVNKDGL
ncbi:MAG: PHP domain-containing protein, partial [Bacilli bacterium]|nr:PHP domain-containing protein [Bacilli bacterium]